MANEQELAIAEEDYQQLTQVHVPLEEAARAFSVKDADGRIPIVVIPERLLRIRTELALVAVGLVIAAWLSSTFIELSWLFPLSVVIAILLFVLAFFSAFRVRIPEGVHALLSQGGKYTRTIGSGMHFVLPWVVVTHLVTRREIPFTVPVVDAPTQDNVRANLNTLITFAITDAYRFVYNISADDFDMVFQASCQDGFRAMVRQIMSDQINDLVRKDLTEFRENLSQDVEPYGVTIMKVNIIYAQPPEEFMQSQEAQKLAVLQQAEQAEKQALALRRQLDEAALARQKVISQVEQELEALQIGIQQAEARRRVEELEAATEEMRLAKLEKRLRDFPLAVRWEWQGEQLNVARSLAANPRAVVQMGNTDALVRALLMRDFISDAAIDLEDDSAMVDGSGADTLASSASG